MKLTVRVPELPEGVEIDPTRLEKALRWAIADGWEPGSVWAVNSIPVLAQLEEMVFLDGHNGLAELFEGISKQLGLPFDPGTLSLLAKGKVSNKPQPGQIGFDFEQQHPREAAGTHDLHYKPGEFVPKDKPQEPAVEEDKGVRLPPKQRAKLQVQGWSEQVHGYRQALADHMTGERPVSLSDLDRMTERFLIEAKHYDGELTAAIQDPENGGWVTEMGLGQEISKLRRWTASTRDMYESEARRVAHELMVEGDGWRNLQDRSEIVLQRAHDVWGHYSWLAALAETEPEEDRIQEERKEKSERLFSQARKLKAAATRERNKVAKFFKEQAPTGRGFTRQQRPFEQELSLAGSKWKWKDTTGQIQGSGLSNPMSQDKWDALQGTYKIPGAPEGFLYIGPTDPESELLRQEARRAAEHLASRVPAWLLERIAANGGEVVWSAAPPSRVGFKTQADYDAWIAPRNEARLKSNDPRHWDDVAGFYRHSDKKAYQQTGYSNDGGSVNLELHEYGHMVDFLFNGGAGGRGAAVSSSPEFRSIWESLKPWLDDYYTKDGDAAELFAEGFDVFCESEQNRTRMLSKDMPQPIRRLGQFFQRFLTTGDYVGREVAKSLWLRLSRRDTMQTPPKRFASGRTTENGEVVFWDGEPRPDEKMEERHPDFPTLFLSKPRKIAEEETDHD